MTQQQVRTVLVGAGHLGSFHLQKILADDKALLVGVVEPDAAHRQRAQQAIDAHFGNADAKPVVSVVASLADFCVEADAAIIAAPTRLHLPLGLQAFARGWHVLMEKPLASSYAEGLQLTQAASAAGKHLQVGHLERFNPAVVAAAPYVRGARYVTCERLGRLSGRSLDVDVILDIMVHDLDLILDCFGDTVTEVRAVGMPVLTEAVDMAAARLQFACGAVAQLSAGRASFEPCRKLRYFTPQAYVSIDCMAQSLKVVRRVPAPADKPSLGPQIVPQQVDVQPSDALAAQDRAFFAACLQQAPLQVSGADGLRVLALAERIVAAFPPWPKASAQPAA